MTGGIAKEDFERWCACMKRFASHPKVYMKLSGGFSELSTERVTETSPEKLAARVKPWLDQVFRCFGPERIMFGSDWPVCNVRGPGTEESWILWKNLVDKALVEQNLDESQKRRVWTGTAREAYKLGV